MKEECKHKNLIYTQKETYCRECGEVFSPKMYNDLKFKYPEINKDIISKELTCKTFYDKNIGSKIGIENVNGFGRKLTKKEKYHISRLKRSERLSKRYILPRSKSFLEGVYMIDSIAENLSTPNFVKDSTRLIYRNAHACSNYFKGKSIERVVAASLILAYKHNNLIPPPIENILKTIPKNKLSKDRIDKAIEYLKSKNLKDYLLDRIQTYLNSDDREEIIFRNIRKILKNYKVNKSIIARLGMLIRTKAPTKTSINQTVKFMKKRLKIYPVNPIVDTYLKQYAVKLNLPDDIVLRGLNIYKIFEDIRKNDKKSLIKEVNNKKSSYTPSSPAVLAIASLYQAILESSRPRELTQKTLTETAGIVEPSLRNAIVWISTAIKIYDRNKKKWSNNGHPPII